MATTAAAAVVLSNSISSSTTTRRLHYQAPAVTNGSLAPSSSELANLNESLAPPSMAVNLLVTIVYWNASLSQENQQLLLNSYASCRRLLDHMKQVVGVQQDETIDLMDNEGKIKDLHTHFDDYATLFLTARSTYYVLKVEVDSATGEKRYTPNFNLDQIDPKLSTTLTNALNTLNKSVKQKRPIGTSRQNTTVQSASTTPQSKTKRTPSRK